MGPIGQQARGPRLRRSQKSRWVMGWSRQEAGRQARRMEENMGLLGRIPYSPGQAIYLVRHLR